MKDLIVVYQFGKVASSSIVATLNTIENIECYQSHFLGNEFFLEILNQATQPTQSHYFVEHQIGQLVSNIRLLRKINCFRQNLNDEGKLAFISIAREPIQWFRSSISQDIKGYLPYFHQALTSQSITVDSDRDAIEKALPIIFGQIHKAIQLGDSIEKLNFSKIKKSKKEIGIFDDLEMNKFLKFLVMFQRPHTWFQQHFETFMGFSLSEMTKLENHLYAKKCGWCESYVFRYEDISDAVPTIFEFLGLNRNIELKRENLTKTKDFNDSIEKVFQNSLLMNDLKICSKSRYTEIFGY
ncbi:MAG TPA: hypothetical protein IGS17_01615 [Oscillatoriales cyanobacterium M59_W2019_021]|nr:hypothetical protein [Oscillatoriales cyanobacterium M4454_W2019_049]HIK49613.1 hypothetical protein [Oscillatoriales cyanobacterium M59_W2019_021]